MKKSFWKNISRFIRSIPSGILALSVVWSYFRPEIATSFLHGFNSDTTKAIEEFLQHEKMVSMVLMLLYLISAIINFSNDNCRNSNSN